MAKKKALSPPPKLTPAEKKTLGKILGKARAHQQYYRATGKAPQKG